MNTIIVPKNVNVIIHDRKYYSAIINDRPNVYSFLNKESAIRCSNFLATFKHKYNKFPIIEEKYFNKVYFKPVSLNKRVSVEHIINTELYIQELDTMELQTKCSMFNIGLVGIEKFDYEIGMNSINLNFSLVDLSTDKNCTVPPEEYLESLFNEF